MPSDPGGRGGHGSGLDVEAEVAAMRLEMEAAAQALDFDRARILRDRLNLIRGGASVEAAKAADTSGFTRQLPGQMGLGTSQQRMTPPQGWQRPEKPDPMTRGTGRRRPKTSS